MARFEMLSPGEGQKPVLHVHITLSATETICRVATEEDKQKYKDDLAAFEGKADVKPEPAKGNAKESTPVVVPAPDTAKPEPETKHHSYSHKKG